MQNGNSLTGGSFLLSALSNKSETTPVPVGMVPATTVGKKMNFGSAKQKVGTITIIGVCAQKCKNAHAKGKLTHRRELFVLGALQQIRNHPRAGGDGASDNSGKNNEFRVSKAKSRNNYNYRCVCAKMLRKNKDISPGSIFFSRRP